jgi:hypothetical protein
MRKLMLLCLLLLLVLQAPAAADSAPVSVPEFAARLERAADAVEQGRPGDVARELPAQVAVAVPGGTVTIDEGWVGRAMADQALSIQDRARLAEQLRAMAREARAVAQSGQPGLEVRLERARSDRAVLEQILGGAGYRKAAMPSWWSRFWQRVGQGLADAGRRFSDWWSRQWSWLPDLPGLPQGSTARAVGVAVLLVILGGGLWLARPFLKWERLGRLLRRRPKATAVAPSAPADLRRSALALAEQGERREAIKLLMQAVLGRLSARRLIDWQPTLTNRTCVAQLRRRRPDLAPPLDELNRLYEWKVYGERPASAEEFRRSMELADHLWEEGSPSSGS